MFLRKTAEEQIQCKKLLGSQAVSMNRSMPDGFWPEMSAILVGLGGPKCRKSMEISWENHGLPMKPSILDKARDCTTGDGANEQTCRHESSN